MVLYCWVSNGTLNRTSYLYLCLPLFCPFPMVFLLRFLTVLPYLCHRTSILVWLHRCLCYSCKLSLSRGIRPATLTVGAVLLVCLLFWTFRCIVEFCMYHSKWTVNRRRHVWSEFAKFVVDHTSEIAVWLWLITLHNFSIEWLQSIYVGTELDGSSGP